MGSFSAKRMKPLQAGECDVGPKVIAVIGATGGQGGGLVRSILLMRAAGFAMRAVTKA